ncbi:hypothetical protein NLL50_08365 [Corynebacterium propinquum]|nr:hypothetical protein [Corynebacterium propinquum]WKS35388.1 hypothetical protein NLL50_08365 [Corynebacterium propinquum]
MTTVARRDSADKAKIDAIEKKLLANVAMQLNRRPRKTLSFDTPAERMATLLESTET